MVTRRSVVFSGFKIILSCNSPLAQWYLDPCIQGYHIQPPHQSLPTSRKTNKSQLINNVHNSYMMKRCGHPDIGVQHAQNPAVILISCSCGLLQHTQSGMHISPVLFQPHTIPLLCLKSLLVRTTSLKAKILNWDHFKTKHNC
jgi:hypothetical protein